MVLNNDWNSTTQTYYIDIILNIPQNKTILNITNNNYKVDFTIGNSLKTILGFNSQIYSFGCNLAENIANITSTQMMYILCDLIEPNLIFSNGTLKYVQYLRGKPAYTERISISNTC